MVKSSGNLVRLQTKNFIVRSVTPGDVTDHYMSWVKDPELPHLLGLNVPKNPTKDQFRKYVTGFDNQSSFHLLITTKDNVEVGYYWVHTEPANKTALSHVMISNRDYWGKAAVLETRAALLDYLFFSLGMDKVLGRPLARNFSAIFNYKAQGFTMEGILREQILELDGSRADQIYFGLLRAEWLEAKKKGSTS